MKSEYMNKQRIILISIGIIALLLLLAACQQPKQEAPAKKSSKQGTNGAEGKTTPDTSEKTQQPAEEIKTVDVESMPEPAFTLEYCNKRIGTIRNDLQKAQENLADEQADLKRLQGERSDEQQKAIATTTSSIKSLTAEVSGLQRGLESMEKKCKSITSNVCAEFTTDAQQELNDQKQELLNEQKELDYVKDPKKQSLQRRKIVLLQKQVDEWAGIVNELTEKCK